MFGLAVTVADVDGVSIETVLNDRDEFVRAARIARAMVAVERQGS